MGYLGEQYSTIKTDMRRFWLTTFAVLSITLCFSQESTTVGQRITGDFNGDGNWIQRSQSRRSIPKQRQKGGGFSFLTRPFLACDLAAVKFT
jgi:hypothetical protein